MEFLEDNSYYYTSRMLARWRVFVIITVPIILLPVLIIPHFSSEARCAYVMLVVMIYWITDVFPLAVTSLLPIALLPMFRLTPSNVVTLAYMKDLNMLVFTAIACALAVEYSNLHQRIALRILLLIGTKPRWLILGFLFTTMFLSMWLNNVSSTALMVPIAESILAEIYPWLKQESDSEEEIEYDYDPPDSFAFNVSTKIRNGVMLSICTGANIGGTGTLMGTAPNLIMSNAIDEAYPDGEVDVSYIKWMLYCTPNALICTALIWLIFQLQFLGFKATFACRRTSTSEESDINERTTEILQEKYDELGRMTFHESVILGVFFFLVFLWIFRDPGFMPGWVTWINNKVLFNLQRFARKIKESSAAVLGLIFLFALPATPDWWWSDIADDELDEPPPRCLTWEIIHARFSWGVIFILGAGFALADACKTSGLSAVIAQWLMILEGTSPLLLCVIVQVITVAMTTVTSNTSTTSILMPILVEMAYAMNVSPYFLLIPATLCASFSFILPISTPTNAIVFETGNIDVKSMAVTGFLSAVVCVCVTTITITLFGPLIFSFEIGKHPYRQD